MRALLPGLSGRLRRLELRRWLTRPDDHLKAIVHVRAGAGGEDAARWALAALRMYMRWAESHGFRVDVLDHLDDGEGDGLSRASLAVEAPGAHGLLRAEAGVHRFVDVPPGEPDGRRHVASVEVDVTPDLAEDEGPTIDPADMEFAVFRNRGFSCGGTNWNGTVPGAVRVTHRPTGLAFSCGEGRSQHSNRAQAVRMLRGKLAARVVGGVSGGPVRSYVLGASPRVVDLRTGHETTEARSVLDGGLDDFIEASLRRG